MSLITGNIKSLLNIKVKARHDNLTDQFSRIFMVKMTLVASMLLGLNWLKDEITCIIPSTTGMDGGGKAFVHEACWIQGFYIYKDIPKTTELRRYYGIPRQLQDNGVDPNGRLCTTSSKNPNCEALEKTFYLQYQWFPFYMAALGLLYYVPYVLFRVVNTDLISLKDNIKGETVEVDDLVTNYFNYQINPPAKLRMRVIGNICVKLCYVIANIVVFATTDLVINGDFKEYGRQYVRWGNEGNEIAYDYTTGFGKHRAGDELLPTFGICEVLELSKDIKHNLYNQHRFVCEISQNVLYQYVLIILWFLFIFGIIVSCFGLVIQLVSHLVISCFLTKGSQARQVYEELTVRECEYLEFIRRKDMALYGKIIRKLKEDRFTNYRGLEEANGHLPLGNQTQHTFQASQKLLDETVPRL